MSSPGQPSDFKDPSKLSFTGGQNGGLNATQLGGISTGLSAIEDYLPEDQYGTPSTGKQALSTLSNIASFTSTGMMIGGPVGAGIGAGLGVAVSIFDSSQKRKEAQKRKEQAWEIEKLNKIQQINSHYSNIVQMGRNNLNNYQSELDLVSDY